MNATTLLAANAPLRSVADWQADFSSEDGGQRWPFVEDENGNITGYGRQDPHEFAAAANRYDEARHVSPLPPEEQWSADDVGHARVLPELDASGDWLLRTVDGPDEPAGTIWVTTLWNLR